MNHITVTPVLVTTAIVVASLFIGLAATRNLESVRSQAIDKRLRENSLLIQNTFNSYEQMMWSGVARINSAPVDRSMWSAFIDTYQLQKKYPAISRIVVTRVVHPDERDGVLADLSEEYQYPVAYSGDIPEESLNIIMYSSPEQSTTVNNIGYNVNSSINRREAIERATDENAVAMSDQTDLIANARTNETHDGSAFLLYAPYYERGQPIDTVDQRRAALKGHVSAAFRTEQVFSKIFEQTRQSNIATRVWAGKGTEKELVYHTPQVRHDGEAISRYQTASVYGQTFEIEYLFENKHLVSAAQSNVPVYAVVFGSITGLLVGTITFFFLRGRYHQVLLDKERDVARAKDELLSLASHQLRTPATGVKQYMGMVLQGFAGDITDMQKDLLEKAYKSNERQLRVINDILHLAKLDMGRIVLAKTSFDLRELVADVVDEQKQDADAGEIKVVTKLPKKAPVFADKHMLRMVIENLLSNAIKYTDPKGTVTVRLQQSGDGYRITVKDTGVGIAAEDTPLLFKQFSRLRNQRSHMVTGTGVGLYLAKHLTLLHNGDIVVDSVVGKGSTFTVYIPKNNENV